MLIPAAVSAGEERVLIDPRPVPAAELITPAGQNLLTTRALQSARDEITAGPDCLPDWLTNVFLLSNALIRSTNLFFLRMGYGSRGRGGSRKYLLLGAATYISIFGMDKKQPRFRVHRAAAASQAG